MKFNAKYCNDCKRLFSEDKYHCSICFNDELELKELTGDGEIYSFTKIHAAPEHLAEIAPYYILLVDLDEGLRLTVRYEGGDPEIGERVKYKRSEGKAYIFCEEGTVIL